MHKYSLSNQMLQKKGIQSSHPIFSSNTPKKRHDIILSNEKILCLFFGAFWYFYANFF